MKYLFVCLALVGLTACTDAQRAKYTSIGSAHHIQLYSGGKLIGEWDSTGAVTNEGQSDGFVFVDKKTRVNTEIAGEVIITQE
jgi:hypothetical protein